MLHGGQQRLERVGQELVEELGLQLVEEVVGALLGRRELEQRERRLQEPLALRLGVRGVVRLVGEREEGARQLGHALDHLALHLGDELDELEGLLLVALALLRLRRVLQEDGR